MWRRLLDPTCVSPSLTNHGACTLTHTKHACSPPAAVNANGDDSATAASSTSDVVVGAPLSPTITAVTGSVGQLTVQWSAPAINADLGVTYKLNIQDVTTGREPADETLVTLAAGAGSQTISGLPAGTKRVWITATNANAGDGSAVVAAWAGAVQVGLSTAPGIASSDGVVGSALGATIALTAPSAVSTTGGKLNKFLIEVGWLGVDSRHSLKLLSA